MTNPNREVTEIITGANVFTASITVRGKGELSISGVSDSTVTLQRSFDAGSTWKDVEAFTASTEKIIEESNVTNVIYRVGVKTGDYGTDTVVCGIYSRY